MRAACGVALLASIACGGEAGFVAPSGPVLVVANQRTGDATIIEIATGRIVATVEVGIDPHEVAASPNGRMVALTSPSAGMLNGRKVVLLDVDSARVIRTIELEDSKGPHGVAFASDTTLIVSTMYGRAALRIDPRDGRVLRSETGLPEDPYVVALARNGKAYVSSPHSNVVTELDASGRQARNFPIEEGPAGIAVSRDGNELWAALWTDSTGGALSVVNLVSGGVVARVDSLAQPRRLAFSGDGRRLIASDRDHLRIVDRDARRIAASVQLGTDASASGVTCAPDAPRCYVALLGSGEVVEVDVADARVLRRFPVEPGADGIAYVRR